MLFSTFTFSLSHIIFSEIPYLYLISFIHLLFLLYIFVVFCISFLFTHHSFFVYFPLFLLYFHPFPSLFQPISSFAFAFANLLKVISVSFTRSLNCFLGLLMRRSLSPFLPNLFSTPFLSVYSYFCFHFSLTPLSSFYLQFFSFFRCLIYLLP